MKPYTRGIILNADDYGVMDFLNQGIKEGIEAGVVTSVSAFVTFGEKNLRAIEQLHKLYGDRIGIGLHFTMTAGKPIGSNTEVGSLYGRYGKNQDRFRLLQRLDLKHVERSEVKLELCKQIELLAERLGGLQYIDHINSHQGVLDLIPSHWGTLLEILAKTDYNTLPIRSPATYEMEYGLKPDGTRRLPIKKLALRNVQLVWNPSTLNEFRNGDKCENRRNKQKEAKGKKLYLPDYFIQSYFGQPSPSLLETFIKDLGEGTAEVGELMLHLGKDTYRDEYNRRKHWGIRRASLEHRADELKVLKQANLDQLLAQYDVTKIKYRDIKPASTPENHEPILV